MALSSLLLISLALFNCKAPPPASGGGRQPVVRVGVVEQKARVLFRVPEKVDFRRANGTLAFNKAGAGLWAVETIGSAPASVVYRLAFGSAKDRASAQKIASSIRRKGIDAVVKRHRLQSPLSVRYAHKATYQVLLRKQFRSEEAATIYQKSIRDRINGEVLAIPRGRASGRLRFTNKSTGQSFDARQPIRIQSTQVQIADIDVGSGFHWQGSETRRYGGIVEFRLDFTGNITVVNYLKLEEYLKGVVPSEMPASFPYEALKAQAVAARVEALSKIGLRHPFESFDLCDDVHCQVFSGLSKQAEKTNRAVESTRGIFMIDEGNLAEAFYSSVCGGHTESNENVWVMNRRRYLRGLMDMPGRSRDRALNRETDVREWIDSSPDAYCNTTRPDTPASVSYSKRYFRWRVEYGRNELEQIIREKTGEDFGNLLDLRPILRGVSGRLIELEIVGSRKRFRVSKELAIRQALSKRTLYSACFYVKKVGGSHGLARKFILHGAGWGHGVGMCQVGAAVMAHRGKKYDQILTHYYKGIFLEKLYN